jgi:hypothetical protein
MPRIYHEPSFSFRDSDELRGRVDLQIFQRADDKIVAVVSELIRADGSEANEGVSATDGIEQIATAIVTKLGFVFDFLIEHYPAHGQTLDLARSNVRKSEMHEAFHLISLRWDNTASKFRVDQSGEAWAWKQLNRSDAEKIIGEPFRLSAAPGSDE